jgi:hypothetical protein
MQPAQLLRNAYCLNSILAVYNYGKMQYNHKLKFGLPDEKFASFRHSLQNVLLFKLRCVIYKLIPFYGIMCDGALGLWFLQSNLKP